MIRAALKSLLSHKLRLLLSSLAVALGVLSVSGALVLTDTLSRSYSAMFDTAYDYVDVSVSAPPKVDTGYQSVPATLPAAVLDQVRAVPGAARVTGSVATVDGARVIGPDGKVLTSFGAPRFGVNWNDQDESISMRTGRGPRADDEVAINGGLAKATGYGVGDRIDVLTLQPRRTFTVVGVFGYGGGRDSLAGETMVAFTTPVAQQLLLGERDVFTSIDLRAAPGVSQTELCDRVRTAVDRRYRVQTGDELSAEAGRQVRQAMSFFNYILLGFAAVALFVGIFLILNTFSIIVAQRLRELALLRAIGASRAQVIGSIELEALLVGLLSSVAGLLLGVGSGRILAWLYATNLGGGVTLAPVSVPGAAILGGLTVGIAVTMLAALLPALRAAQIPPVAAISQADGNDRGLARPTVIGTALTIVGMAGLLAGLADRVGGNSLVVVLGGLLLTLTGVALLTPVIARPVLAVLGAAFRRWTPGRLGERNSARNPRRTAITAAALMIGIALITGINVVLTSATRSLDHILDTQIKVDLIVSGEQTGALAPTFDGTVLDRTRALSGVRSVVGIYTDVALVDERQTMVAAVTDSTALRTMFGITPTAGRLDGLAAGEVILDADTATAQHVAVGDRIRVQLSRGNERVLTVVGSYPRTPGMSGWILSRAELPGFRSDDPSLGLIQLAPGASAAAVKAQVATMLHDSPEASVLDRSGFVRQQTRGFDLLLGMVQLLVALSIVIAVLGIVNTLALSVLERTRELGLLRAVGLRRGQLIEMVGVESLLISVFGAALGVGVGAALGAAIARALKDQGIVRIGLPWGQMLTYLALGAVIGLVAGVVPAIRAGRLNLLDAIAYE